VTLLEMIEDRKDSGDFTRSFASYLTHHIREEKNIGLIPQAILLLAKSIRTTALHILLTDYPNESVMAVDSEGKTALDYSKEWCNCVFNRSRKYDDIVIAQLQRRSALNQTNPMTVEPPIVTQNIFNLIENNGTQAEQEFLDYIKQFPASIHSLNSNSESALCFSMRMGKFNLSRKMINLGADVNQPNPADQNMTPLLYAVALNMEEFCRVIINRGVKLNAVNAQGMAALHLASSLGHIEIVELLLTYPVSLDLKNNDNKTALQLTSNTKIARLLQDKMGVRDMGALEELFETVQHPSHGEGAPYRIHHC